MTISMYKVSVPAFARGLSGLKTVLTKGAAHAAAKKIDEAGVPERARLTRFRWRGRFTSRPISRAAPSRGWPAASRRSGRTTRRRSPNSSRASTGRSTR